MHLAYVYKLVSPYFNKLSHQVYENYFARAYVEVDWRVLCSSGYVYSLYRVLILLRDGCTLERKEDAGLQRVIRKLGEW
jgi:hypothetical protein